jgi:hypothetical protein
MFTFLICNLFCQNKSDKVLILLFLSGCDDGRMFTNEQVDRRKHSHLSSPAHHHHHRDITTTMATMAAQTDGPDSPTKNESTGTSWKRPTESYHAHFDCFSGAAGDMVCPNG